MILKRIMKQRLALFTAGPRLIAFSGLLMACLRQSKRRAALFLSIILYQPAGAAWIR